MCGYTQILLKKTTKGKDISILLCEKVKTFYNLNV